MISSDEAHTDQHGTPDPTTFGTKINAPDATQLAFEAYTLARRQCRTARSKRLPKSSTACFGFDTPILMDFLGIAYWKTIHKADKGESVVQILPSGNIEDLTDALITPIKTTCCFDRQTGGNDMVRMGSCIITPHHQILTADGWMTARQAAARGQGEILVNSNIPRVYNLCLKGGGNILINTSCLPGATTFTTAATMGYRFELATDPQQMGSLTYPTDVRTRLGLRQDLKSGRKHFSPGEVRTLPNEELIFRNITGDILVNKRPGTGPMLSRLHTIPSPNNSPAVIRLAQFESKTATTLDKSEISGEQEEKTVISSHLSAELHSDQARLVPRKSQPKSDTANAKSELEISYEPANKNPHFPNSFHSDITTSPHSTEEIQLDQATAQENWLTPSFTPDTHILILKADKATWIQIGDAKRGATVIQSLPSGYIGDVSGAQSATIERV